MDDLRNYLLTFLFTAALCGVLQSIFKEGTLKEHIKLLCGVIMAVTMFRPLCGLDFQGLQFPDVFSKEAAHAASMGEAMSKDATRDIIKEQMETYIMDKANSLGAAIEVRVSVSETGFPIPESVDIRGSIPVKSKLEMISYLTNEMGIAREDQHWGD